MANHNGQSRSDLWMLGAVITVPLVLASGPLAGYVLGRYVFLNFFHVPEKFLPVFIGLGLLASALQVFRIVQRIKQSDKSSQKK